MSKHTPTPGPWKSYWRSEDGAANCGIFHEARPGQAKSVARCPRYNTREQWEADAALICAAPDLLAALEYIMSDVEPTEHALSTVARDMARAAITKAKGEA